MPSQFKTIFTAVDTTELQISPAEWTLVSLKLESAGPVIAGTRAELALASGIGVQLGTEPRYFLLGPTERLYTRAGALNRVTIATHTLPNLIQVVMKIDALLGKIIKKFSL